MTLANKFNNLRDLLADEGLQRHFEWVGKQKVKVDE